MLALSSDQITIQQLGTILPDVFKGQFENTKVCNRLKIEALYQTSINDQQDDIERVEHDQSLLIPTDINYNQ